MFSDLGVVAIGRNEGPRLKACLKSALHDSAHLVYVDSGSTDDSVSMAIELGADVVSLDRSRPFSAARGRNAGFQRLMQITPELRFVQFVDGDCEIAEGWLQQARAALLSNPQTAAVCGRRRERYPEASIFNQICDIEWDTPIGETRVCGGDAMFRCDVVHDVGGYKDDVIAGEDYEICVRIRQRGWKLQRLDHEMTMHDVNMHKLSQWWKRAVRCGHAFAEGFAMHGRAPERHFAKPLRSVVFWGGILPLLAIVLCWPTHFISLGVLALAYALLWLKATRAIRRRGRPTSLSMIYAASCVGSKLPECIGASQYVWRQLTRTSPQIIEYK
ncbi:N-glycosyltransferase [Novipirellula galeiformis]|uniref:N-glycosyltransferase n=1 Tax=Novipirellula galeiformis TaxID=2528004 RepID=A0A5C6CLD1_9BACT|nr:glycosyltransferase [Novipirellula galeiformis]TWU23946.1 N-glycosyltransferase [Novipirellula galeiformis]